MVKSALDDPGLQLITETATVLAKLQAQPNILTLEEWRRYAVLFQKPDPNMTDIARVAYGDKLKLLMDEYSLKVDPYRQTHVIESKSNPKVLLKLPQIFVAVKSIAPTEKNTRLVDSNLTGRHSDLMSVKSGTQNAMSRALLDQQRDQDQITQYVEVRATTRALVNALNLKAPTSQSPIVPIASPSGSPDLFVNVEMEDL